jgi:hypothetical protein
MGSSFLFGDLPKVSQVGSGIDPSRVEGGMPEQELYPLRRAVVIEQPSGQRVTEAMRAQADAVLAQVPDDGLGQGAAQWIRARWRQAGQEHLPIGRSPGAHLAQVLG